MKDKFNINDLNIVRYYDNIANIKDVILLFDVNVKYLYKKLKENNIDNFMLINITNFNWYDDLTPWPSDISKGKGDILVNKILDILTTIINFKYTNLIACGYSLAGLFAIYLVSKSSLFNKVIACSASLWYPNFISYFKSLDLRLINIYLSIGKKEISKKYGNMVDITNKFYLDLKDKYNIHFELNDGNHYSDSNYRLFKGLFYILDNK